MIPAFFIYRGEIAHILPKESPNIGSDGHIRAWPRVTVDEYRGPVVIDIDKLSSGIDGIGNRQPVKAGRIDSNLGVF